jgi:hypothetical protein
MNESEVRFADVAEGVKATIAAYALALDDGRVDEVVATFLPDGGCDIPGLGAHEGHDALRAAYARVMPRRPQRHLVVNTSITEWTETEATAVSDLVFLLHGETGQGAQGWTVQLVGRYHDTLRRTLGPDGATWRFLHRRAEFQP